MTRMWMVDISDMCPMHRRGEHKEIHDLVGFIRGGHIEKVVFHASRGQVFPRQIAARHEALEQHEGFDSPIDIPEVADDLQMAEPTDNLIRFNRERLARNCGDCCHRMVS